MARQSAWRWAAAAILMTAATGAQAAESLLQVLPKYTLGVVLVNHLAELDAKLIGAGQAMQLPLPGMLSLLKAQAGVTTGLDEKGSALLVIVGGEELDAEPANLLYLPVTDYQQFIGQLSPQDEAEGLRKVVLWKAPFVVRQAGKYAVFAEGRHKELLREAAAKTAPPEELTPLVSLLTANDLSAAITRHGLRVLNAQLQEQLKQLEETLSSAPDQMKFAGKVFGIYRNMFAAAEREVTTIAAGLSVEKSGALRGTVRVRVKPDSKLAARLAALRPIEGNPLAGLPAQPFLFAVGGGAAGMDWKEWTSGLGDFWEMAFSLYGLSAADGKRMMELSTQSMRGLRGMSFAMLALGNEPPLYRDVVGIMQTADADAFLDDYRRTIANINQIWAKAQGGIVKMQPTEIEEVKVQGLRALKLAMSIPMAAEMPGGNEQLLEAMMGKGGKMAFHVVAIDKQRVLFTYQAKTELLNETVTALTQQKPCLAADPLVSKTTALLPSQPLGVGCFSPQGAIGIANRFLTVMPFMGSGPLPAFPAVPPIGAAVTTAAAEVQGHLVIPAEVVVGIKNYALQMMIARAGGQAPATKKETKKAPPAATKKPVPAEKK